MPSPDGGALPEKVCRVCGRRFAWRKKWRRDWPEVRHCSQQCRRQGLDPIDQQLEDTMLALLAQRSRNASICPFEASKRVDPDDPHRLNGRARNAARRLAEAGKIEIRQKGQRVDPSALRGPIRLVRLDGPAEPLADDPTE